MKKKVAVGLSGGVDSSFAAYLLKQQGFDVIGFTLKFTHKENRCCDLDGLYRAQRLCQILDIPHYTLDASRDFSNKIMDCFLDSYLKGLTPNPCALCNRFIKFGFFLEKAQALGIKYVATGHYVRLVKQGGNLLFAQAKDTKKTQEYFLSMVDKERLPYLVFPLGDFTKEEVKYEVIRKHLVYEERKESQDICFIDQKPYTRYIENKIRGSSRYAGDIVHVNSKVLGKHPGIYYYTYGQREGLGISWREPLYVVGIDAVNKNVIVGERKFLYLSQFMVGDMNWFIKTEALEKKPFLRSQHIFVKIRYNSKLHQCTLAREGDFVKIGLSEQIEAVTPGQIAALYYKNMVIGAGVIQKRNLTGEL